VKSTLKSNIHHTSKQTYVSLFGRVQVLLQVNVGVHFFGDPIIEILQFEKYQERNWFTENQENLNYSNYDPCRELLKLLLHVNTLSSTVRSLPPPRLSSNSGFGSASQKSSSSVSQLFSHFRSYSMSSLPQNSAPPPQQL